MYYIYRIILIIFIYYNDEVSVCISVCNAKLTGPRATGHTFDNFDNDDAYMIMMILMIPWPASCIGTSWCSPSPSHCRGTPYNNEHDDYDDVHVDHDDYNDEHDGHDDRNDDDDTQAKIIRQTPELILSSDSPYKIESENNIFSSCHSRLP